MPFTSPPPRPRPRVILLGAVVAAAAVVLVVAGLPDTDTVHPVGVVAADPYDTPNPSASTSPLRRHQRTTDGC